MSVDGISPNHTKLCLGSVFGYIDLMTTPIGEEPTMTLNKSLVCLAIASLSIPAMAAPVTTEGAGVGKHGDVIAAVTFDGGRIQAIDIR